ncbi:hypothetical protein BCR36DRAFT_340864 [Piromyces finnis]|uniref:CBM10 domain-containing protein n=1 Tax=Piromyces finnis TaxID=1754191 RepID=A0A1Y1VPU7_9FUNG|nr:hypothetical protein BCR36DRAFT_340864 [Piromyces finnis]|eukprot:ORX60891.1 hypothetical protein BCR36DRAFT_340864 [Piromyces finnis]
MMISKINTIIIFIIFYFSILVNGNFWKNVKRTELYEMMDKSIPEMHINIDELDWENMCNKAQISSQYQNIDFEVDAKLTFIYEGKSEVFNIEFKLGGKSSTEYKKPGFNIKIKGSKNNLHGTKHFRLRGDIRDASMMRSKVTSDILQRSGLVSVEVGYTELYINNKYLGFWVVSDSVKNKWIQRKFKNVDDNIANLIQCRDDRIRFDDESAKTKCVNSNNEYSDYMDEFNNFVDQVNAAKTRSDLEKIMEVDNFIKYMAWEYITLSWDHFIGIFGHNIYWFKQPNGKWVYIPYDYDLELGQDLWVANFPGRPFYIGGGDIDFTNISFEDYELNHPILKILIRDDDTFFRECIGDIISKIFNPDILLIHIDEIRNLISPYVKRDRDLGAGKINNSGKDISYSYQHFIDNSEYKYLFDYKGSTRGYGLKDWIRRRYSYLAVHYGIDRNHKLIMPRPVTVNISYIFSSALSYIGYDKNVNEIYNPNQLPPYTPDPDYSDDTIPTIGVNVNANVVKNSSLSNSNVSTSTSCWAEEQGYQCCSDCDVIYEDNNGLWGIENGTWCGINSTCKLNTTDTECFSINLGYPCCSTCTLYFENSIGRWGIENNEWCGLKSSC